jgi:hypothetical protein
MFVVSPALWAGGAVVTQGPTLTLNPNGTTPLAGVVELETDVPTMVQLVVTSGLHSFSVNLPTVTAQHYIPVVGMKADRTYTVEVNLIPGGNVGTLFTTTDPLPADFPVITTVVSDPTMMEPGFTLTDCMVEPGGGTTFTRYSMAVDNVGEVVWYTTHCLASADYLPSGEILYRNNAEAIIMDFVGNQKRVTLQYPGLGSHHDLERTPHGTFLGMDRQNVPIDSFPSSDTDPLAPPAAAVLRDDSIVEFLPDGSLRREWPTADLVDTTRIGYDSLVPIAGGFDWTHGNAAHYRLADDSIVISLRSQDAVVKFSRETGEVEWILGPHENWSAGFQQYLLTPVGTPFQWQYHQHAPMWISADRLLLYDNGNWRTSPFDGLTQVPNASNFSRGVEFQIDEANLEISQVWEYGESIAEPMFTGFIGDADYQPITGNRLMTYGAVAFIDGAASIDLGLGPFHARLVEATDDIVPVRVFELAVNYPGGVPLIIYRSERVPSFYPVGSYNPPNTVGNSLMLDKVGGVESMDWIAPATDASHDAAEHYRLFTSSTRDGGFSIAESTASTSSSFDTGSGGVTYIKIVAANLGGTSGDEPLP